METVKKPGTVTWIDLTIEDAEKVSKFYNEVIGWKIEGIKVGDYEDYVMKGIDNNEAVAGVCHAKGVNKYLPPQWLVYISVNNLEESLEKCKNLGGKVVGDIQSYGEGKFCLIQDPAGAYMMLTS